jgi:hypothetical protein
MRKDLARKNRDLRAFQDIDYLFDLQESLSELHGLWRALRGGDFYQFWIVGRTLEQEYRTFVPI